MFSQYGKLCNEVYDLTKPVGHSLGGDIEFYRDRLSSCNGRILEAAVGSGRLLIPLLEAGLPVDGVDDSEDMLAACRSRCAQRGLHPRLYQARLQDLSLPDKYEAIIVPAGSHAARMGHGPMARQTRARSPQAPSPPCTSGSRASSGETGSKCARRLRMRRRRSTRSRSRAGTRCPRRRKARCETSRSRASLITP